MQKKITLAEWLIKKTDTDAYRAGKLTGKKHLPVEQKLISEVGGMQCLLQQARELEQDFGIGESAKVQVDWRDMKADIQTIHYDISIIPQLCRKTGVKDTREHQTERIRCVREWSSQVADCDWVQQYYQSILTRLEAGKRVGEAEEDQLFLCLNAVAVQKEFVWERVFSARVFQDSKLFQRCYKSKIVTILRNYSPYREEEIEDDELLAMHEIHSYAQTLEWKGALGYRLDDKTFIDTSKNQYGTVLNSQTLEHAVPTELSGCRCIMTVENKANYESMTFEKDVLYLYCHGYFTPKEVRFLKQLPGIVGEECRFLHWGDMDYGGISIFQFIKSNVFPKLMPYKMDRKAFEAALDSNAGVPLDPQTAKKLKSKDAGILEELKQAILESGKTIEQELLL